MKANEAPEKTYLATTKEVQDIDHSFVGIAHSDPRDIVEPIEYVRKDALLEWAKIKQTQCLENSTAYVYFQMFIDKINCM